MRQKAFNAIASLTAMFIGSIYVLNDSASITANVIGASGADAGFLSIVGLAMIVGSIGLFMVTVHHPSDERISLERLARSGNPKHHTDMNKIPVADTYDDKNEVYDDIKRQTKI